MDTDEALNEKIRTLFIKYEQYVRSIPASEPPSFSAKKASSSSRNVQNVEVPHSPKQFLNDFRCGLREVYKLYDRQGRPVKFRDLVGSLEQISVDLSSECRATSEVFRTESGEDPGSTVRSRVAGAKNVDRSPTAASRQEDSDSDEEEIVRYYKSPQLLRTPQSNRTAASATRNFVDLTAAKQRMQNGLEIISLLDSSESDDSSHSPRRRKKLKAQRGQLFKTTPPLRNSAMSASKALRESINMLYARCRKFSRTLPAGHPFRTIYDSLEKTVPDYDCASLEIQIPADPTYFLNDLRSRFDEVYGLCERMGRPADLSERLDSLKQLVSMNSVDSRPRSSFAANRDEPPLLSKNRSSDPVARLKDDSKYVNDELSDENITLQSTRRSVQENYPCMNKAVVLKVDGLYENIVYARSSALGVDDDDSVYNNSTETEIEQRINRVHDANLACTMKREPKQSSCPSTPSAIEKPTTSSPLASISVKEPTTSPYNAKQTCTMKRPPEQASHPSTLTAIKEPTTFPPCLRISANEPTSREKAILLPEPGDEEDNLSGFDVPKVLLNLDPSLPPHSLPSSIKRKMSGHAKESHGEPVYCVSWSKDFSQSCAKAETQSVSRYLSTCGSNLVTVYRIVFDSCHGRRVKSKHFDMTQSYIVDDKTESFYACTFAGRSRGEERDRSMSHTTNMPELLCVGGAKRVIYVIDIVTKKRILTLHGHGESVLSLKPCPTDEWILLSSSEDESIRLWNLRSGAPVAVLKGREGHIDSVISAAWNPSATLIISGGMDTTIKIWDAREGSQLRQAIARSHEVVDLWQSERVTVDENPILVKRPIFSTQKVHVHCVDCVQFIQNGLVLSKSVDSRIELWEPILEGSDSVTLRMKNQSCVEHLHTFEYNKGEVWYMNFATDPLFKLLVVGDCDGSLYVWNIGQKTSAPAYVLQTHGNISVPVRGVAFSPCGNTLVAYRDDGSFYKWDLKFN
ncbi:polycomb protein EED [Fistulifera solaris]|uniref:Polycomb protein EED n=1 Tax=Fistulifera solaris TaxID=1519565 RepID=A0A1Z5JNF4_FISSO|nr:polycomb protein EED [Fistulifera solaris]|eukprot:GAX15550.1 polycomb protein EED [Fistulifera solaris]